MKKIISLITLLAVAFGLASCSSGGGSESKIARILDPLEYTLYTNIFYNGDGDKYTGKKYSKEGIFAEIQDNFNSTKRYYVWGYSDETLCCDWQWEFTPAEGQTLPPIGSRIKIEGTFIRDIDALDGYWIKDASLKTITEYKAANGKFDTTTMSPTLTRVQLINMRNFADKHEGDIITIYGRVDSDNKLQHPYYNGDWSIPLEYDKKLPAIGTYVTVTGKFAGTTAFDSKIEVEKLDVGEK